MLTAGPDFSAGTATAMPLSASLHAPPGCLSLQRTTKRLPPNAFEPQADVALQPSALHLAEKLFKKLLKFRKKAGFSGSTLCRPFMEPETVDMEKRYDSDEHSVEFMSIVRDTPKSSASLRSSSSFDSLVGTPSAITPPTPQKTVMAGSQMMADMLLSLLDDDIDDEDEDTNTGSKEDEKFLGGPRVSAWHQPQDEIVTEHEWRMLRYGHVQGKPSAVNVVSQMMKNTDAADYISYKYLATGGDHKVPILQVPRVEQTSVNRNTVTFLDCLWIRGELPHLLASVLEAFQFNNTT